MEITMHNLEKISGFRKCLIEDEKSEATVKKYVHEAELLTEFLKTRSGSKSAVLEYREALKKAYDAKTVNVKLAAVHSFLTYLGKEEWKVKFLKVQKKAFVEESRELTEKEYKRLLETAKKNKKNRLYYLMLTLGGTGIRISELKYITYEAITKRKVEINMKGKVRLVLIPKCLREKLLYYASQCGIKAGYLFCSRNGKPLNRSNIWRELKCLCKEAAINQEKVFPHNFRHLFAKCYYAIEKDLSHLADILGHSSIETTRGYIAVSTKTHEKTLVRLRLII